MTTVHRQYIPDVGEVTLRPVRPAADAPLIHGWVTRPVNRFWGMGDYQVHDVREVYAYLDASTTHHAYLIRLDGRPVGIFQTYLPAHDPVGECYPVRPGDIGVHLLLCPGVRPPRGLAAGLFPMLIRFALADPSRDRIVVEPDARNAFALRRLRLLGFSLEKRIDMAGKSAQLAFLDRDRVPA